MDDELDKKMREAFEKASEAGELPRGVKTFDDFLNKIQSNVFNNLDANYDYKNKTGDGVLWKDPKVNIDEINEKIFELKS